MAESSSRCRRRPRLALLVITSLGIITLDLRGAPAVDGARGTVAAVMAPVQRAADAALEPFRETWRGATRFDEVDAENRRLREELRVLRAEPVRDELAESRLAAVLAASDLHWAIRRGSLSGWCEGAARRTTGSPSTWSWSRSPSSTSSTW